MLSIALYLLTHAMLLSLHLSGARSHALLSATGGKKYDTSACLRLTIEARNVLV